MAFRRIIIKSDFVQQNYYAPISERQRAKFKEGNLEVTKYSFERDLQDV